LLGYVYLNLITSLGTSILIREMRVMKIKINVESEGLWEERLYK